jgi:NAD(P)H-nitrite reductase large subunit
MAKISKSHIVCKCNLVTLGEIIYAITNRDAKTLEDIKILTDAGATCGCCIDPSCDVNEKKMDLYITQILNKFIKSDNDGQ